MGFPFENGQRAEEKEDRQRRGQRAEPGIAERIIDLNPLHFLVLAGTPPPLASLRAYALSDSRGRC